nr:glycosyltransferase [Pseudodesulfovibrio sp. JC047]
MALYRDSRVIPNESIFGEVNFRLFEGASCGCLVLGQTIEEQAELFEPGREMDTYSHVLELGEKVAIYHTNPRLAGIMGRAAHARIAAEHLPDHRVVQLLEYGANASKNRATGHDAAKWTALTACAMVEAGVVRVGSATLFSKLAAVPQDVDVVAMAFRMQALFGDRAALRRNIATVLARPASKSDPIVCRTASLAAVQMDDVDAARACAFRFFAGQDEPCEGLHSMRDVLMRWAREFVCQGRVVRQGLSFDADRHIPGSAAECLLVILARNPDDQPANRLLESLLRPLPGFEQTRVGLLSSLTLSQRDDWRLDLALGLANLGAYRRQSGLEELRLGLECAVSQGQETEFWHTLMEQDPSGLILAALTA